MSDTSKWRVSVVILACSMAAMPAYAAGPDSSIRTDISNVMKNFMTAWSRHESAQELSTLLYDTSDTFAVVGEGQKQPIEHVPALLKELEHTRNEWTPGCTFIIDGPIKQSGSLVATLTTLNCPAASSAPPIADNILLVWNRTPRGWRVVLESYSSK